MSNVIQKGLAILTSEDAVARREIERYITNLLDQNGYLPVYSPHIGPIELFETSGHYPYYKDDMFAPIEEIPDTELPVGDLDRYLLKPMNCPFHIQAYQSEPRSYRDLPVRYYEFGTVYRNESSGAINGMFRLRGFTQDDGHIFCTMDQVQAEIIGCSLLVEEVMDTFGMKTTFRLSLRDDKEGKWVGPKECWDKAEALLLELASKNNITNIDRGGAAFYGPKIDFVATDKLGREWQLGTIQLDFNLPERFQLEYNSSENKMERPVMIHRALLGSVERFIAILKEQGPLPAWLRREQVRVIPVHEGLLGYGKKVTAELRRIGIRANLDKEIAPLRAKIKNAIDDQIPVRIIVGNKEEEEESVTIERIGQEKQYVRYLDAWLYMTELLPAI